ncbi:phosphoenolpyruvate--protein phosphotransferase [Gephyromycinifex aptenodytis]
MSAGTGSGPVVHVLPAPGPDTDEPATTDVSAASGQVRAALEQVATGLEARLQKADTQATAILQATAMMARDPGLADAVDGQLRQGRGLTHAVHEAVEEYCAMFEQLGGYMAERVSDLRDVRDRAICRLRDLPEPGVPELEQPSVLVALDLAPAETATLTPELTLGLITQGGGPTSHTAILAAQFGIPAVVQVPQAMQIPAGAQVALDGGSGEVIISPTPQEQADFAERSRRREAAFDDVSGPGATRDGTKIALLANIGTADDARAAAQLDLEGSGLFRTEFLFLDRDSAPSLQEQTETYSAVLRAFAGRRVIVRTLDAGADKPLPFADLGPEDNPALGRRGLRLGMLREDLLDTQLQALAAAYQDTGGDLRVMAPMVATVEEAEYFAAKVRAVGLPKVGVMIEVPAAALCAEQILSVVDFASIGTNDLQQYTMAADRLQGELATLLDPWQPGLLQLIKATCDGGRAAQRPIGVCGEAGGDPLYALVLVGLGVTSLSMAPGRVPAVRAALKLHDLQTCSQLAAAAVSARTPQQAKDAVTTAVDPRLLELL